MNRLSDRWALGGLAFLCLLAAGCASGEKDEVLGRLGDVTLRKSDFVKKLDSLPPEFRSLMIERRKEFAEDMLMELLLQKEAAKRKIAEIPEVKDLLETAHKKIVTAKLLEVEVDRKVSLEKDEARRYYDENHREFIRPKLYRASHILLDSEEAAEVTKVAIDQGGNFAEYAKEKSLDRTARRGGDIGFFQKGQLIPEFEEVAFRLKIGQVSDVFKTQFGYHIIKLTDISEPTSIDFEVVKDRIEKQLLTRKRSKVLKTFLDSLKGNAELKLDEKALDALEIDSEPESSPEPEPAP